MKTGVTVQNMKLGKKENLIIAYSDSSLVKYPLMCVQGENRSIYC